MSLWHDTNACHYSMIPMHVTIAWYQCMSLWHDINAYHYGMIPVFINTTDEIVPKTTNCNIRISYIYDNTYIWHDSNACHAVA